MMNILPTSRTTRIVATKPSASVVQDENKAPMGKVADKKVAKRSVLGDISNVTSKPIPGKAAAVKPAEKPIVCSLLLLSLC